MGAAEHALYFPSLKYRNLLGLNVRRDILWIKI